MDSVLSVLKSVGDLLDAHKLEIGSVLGVLFVVAKAVSTEGAGKVVGIVQTVFDGIAKGCVAVGAIAQSAAGLLGALIKSDGIAGKK